MIRDLAELSAKNLTRRGKRSWLTIIGIVIGITAIVALFSLAQGLEDSITQEFEDLGANTIYVLPGSGVQGAFQAGTGNDIGLAESDLEAVRQAQGVEEAGSMIYELETVAEFNGERERVPLVGIPTDSSQEMVMQTNALELDTGRNLRQSDRLSGLASYNLHTGELFGKEVGIRSQLSMEGEEVRVVGTLEQSGDPEYDRSLVIPISSARDLLGEEDRIDNILAKPQTGLEPSKVADEIEEELRKERNVREGEEDFTVATADDLLKSFFNILNTVQYVVIGIVSVALFVGGLGIMNTMYMSVSERTKEIGIMKAIGATRKQILSIYLVEAGVLGLIGGAIGIVVGLGVSEVVFYFIRQFIGMQLYPSRPPVLIFGALGASFLLGVLSGYLPARKAANLEPVEAIRQQ